MRIRFLQTTPSANPDRPFQAGQIIDVSEPSAEMLRWLEPVAEGLPVAEVLPEPAPEAATVLAPERAVRPRAKGRTA